MPCLVANLLPFQMCDKLELFCLQIVHQIIFVEISTLLISSADMKIVFFSIFNLLQHKV